MGVKGLKVLSFPFLSIWGGEGGWGQLFPNCRLLHFCCTKAAIPTQILPWGGWGTFFKTLYCYISVEPSPEYRHKFYQGEEGAVFSKPYPAAFLLTQAHNTNINFTCGSGYNKVKLEKVLQKQNQGNHNKDNNSQGCNRIISQEAKQAASTVNPFHSQKRLKSNFSLLKSIHHPANS